MQTVGATTVGELDRAIQVRPEETLIVAELKAGSEDAYSWLITQFHQPIYSLVYRLLDDPADAPDTVQEVFLKVFRGIQRFQGESSLKTWMYRIAVHEASNRRRWFFRHKGRETSITQAQETDAENVANISEVRDSLVDEGDSPLDAVLRGELCATVEQVLSELPEPYRTTVVLRDIEDLSYEEIAAVMDVSLGTVKSRLVRGRDALRKRLLKYAPVLGAGYAREADSPRPRRKELRAGGQEIEVLP